MPTLEEVLRDINRLEDIPQRPPQTTGEILTADRLPTTINAMTDVLNMVAGLRQQQQKKKGGEMVAKAREILTRTLAGDVPKQGEPIMIGENMVNPPDPGPLQVVTETPYEMGMPVKAKNWRGKEIEITKKDGFRGLMQKILRPNLTTGADPYAKDIATQANLLAAQPQSPQRDRDIRALLGFPQAEETSDAKLSARVQNVREWLNWQSQNPNADDKTKMSVGLALGAITPREAGLESDKALVEAKTEGQKDVAGERGKQARMTEVLKAGLRAKAKEKENEERIALIRMGYDEKTAIALAKAISNTYNKKLDALEAIGNIDINSPEWYEAQENAWAEARVMETRNFEGARKTVGGRPLSNPGSAPAPQPSPQDGRQPKPGETPQAFAQRLVSEFGLTKQQATDMVNQIFPK